MAAIVNRLKRIARRSPALVEAHDRVKSAYRGSRAARLRGDGLNPGNVVWIFCTGRSGSTWLRSMLSEMVDGEVWEEPGVGELFGDFYRRAYKERLRSVNFVMGDPNRKVWVNSMRNFILDTARASNPSIERDRHLIIKEPQGAIGAPLMMEALPESRMVFLIRDPRDVAASALDGSKQGSWRNKRRGSEAGQPEKRPIAFVKNRANSYLAQISAAKRAHDEHAGRKTLVRYEDLRADTPGAMRRACAELGLEVPEGKLLRVVEKHSWENIPEGEKGEGKFHRKASPGGWREDLTPEQIGVIEEITAPLLEEFYPEHRRA